MKIRAKVASSNDLISQDAFTEAQLKKLADTALGVPVTLGFDMSKPIGKITKSELIEKALFVEAEISEEIIGKYLVPGFMLPGYKCIAFGATLLPQDKTLDKI